MNQTRTTETTKPLLGNGKAIFVSLYEQMRDHWPCYVNSVEMDRGLMMRIFKTRWKDVRVCFRATDVDIYPEDNWDQIRELTAEEALKEKNAEKRRVMFWALGPEAVLRETGMVKVKEVTITKNQLKLTGAGVEEIEYSDTYELYDPSIQTLKILGVNVFGRELDSYKRVSEVPLNQPYPQIVKCKCTTTGREYCLWVCNIQEGRSSWGDKPFTDPLAAIAWTIQIPIKNPVSLMRQGDVILVEMPEKPEYFDNEVPQPITADQYKELLTWET